MGRAIFKGKTAFAFSTVTLSLAFLGVLAAPLQGQIAFGNPYDAGIGAPHQHVFGWASPEPMIPGAFFNVPTRAPAPPSTISSDILRHPLSGKAKRLLEKIEHVAESGDHAGAISALREALVKQPAAEPYIQSLLGSEYLETRNFAEAAGAFSRAARILPHEPATHSNLGLSLALLGKFDLAKTELNKALELDKANDKARTILGAIRAAQRRESHRAE